LIFDEIIYYHKTSITVGRELLWSQRVLSFETQ